MAEIRGNLINLTGRLMSLFPDAQKKADDILFEKLGKHWNEVKIDDWIDAKIWDAFMQSYIESSPTGEMALITLGKNIYPAIKNAGQIPPEIDNPLRMLEFEGEGFKMYHKGPDVIPRKFLRLDDHDVLVEAPSPGYNCKVIEGVFQGIVKMFDIETVEVTQTKCVKKGDNTCEYHITW